MLKRLLENAGFKRPAKNGLKGFAKDDRGNIALMTAGFLPPLLIIVGAALDTAEMYRARTVFQNAVDAATLTAAKTIHKHPDPSSAEAATLATNAGERVFRANLTNLPNSPANLVIDTNDGNCAAGITSTATLRHKLFFDGVYKAFVDEDDPHFVNLNTGSEVKCGGDTLEIAMVLDNSGSMNRAPNGGGPRKIDTMRSEATNLVTSLEAAMAGAQQFEPLRFSLVPFSTMVNVGANNRNSGWMDTDGISPLNQDILNWAQNPIAVQSGPGYVNRNTGDPLSRFTLYDNMQGVSWQGCVEARPYPLSINDTPATPDNPSSMFVPTFAPDEPDNWNGFSEQEFQQVAPPPYCVRFNRERRCRDWSDGHKGKNHPTQGFANYFGAEYGGRGVWQGQTGTRKVVVNTGNAIEEGSYYNNYIPDYHNYPSSDQAAVPVAHPSNTGRVEDQFARQKWTTKYFNNPPVFDVNNNATGLPDGPAGYTGGPNYACTVPPLTPLSAQLDDVRDNINAMRGSGTTNVHMGVAWGWRTLSSGQPFDEGRPSTDGDNKKIMIVMTDGNNTNFKIKDREDRVTNLARYSGYGFGASGRIFEGFSEIANAEQKNTTYTKAMDEKLSQTCENAKQDGIQIYSIAFDVPNGSSVKTILEGCASPDIGTSKLYYDASDTAELRKAFEDIADKIAELAISK